MSVSFSSALNTVSKYLPQEISHPSLSKALRKWSPIYRNHFSSYYLEWHLEDPSRIDILSSLTFDSLSRFLSGVTSYSRNSSKNASHDVKATIAPIVPVLSSWNNMNTRLRGGLPHIWLASDYHTATGKFTTPNIHFCVDRNFTNRTHDRAYRNSLSVSEFRKTIATITAAPWPRTQRWSGENLTKTYTLLQQLEGEIIHLSFMHSRVPAIAKLNMTLPFTKLGELLQKLAWKGDPNLITHYCTLFAKNEPRIKGNICLSDSSFTRFELELEYNFPLLSDKRRRMMLTGLKSSKLATAAQIQVLRHWPDREDSTYRNKSYTFERWLDCKISFTPDGTVTAKPYFGYAPLPRIGWNRETMYE